MPTIKNTRFTVRPDKKTSDEIASLENQESVIIYNEETKKLMYNDGSTWVEFPEQVSAISAFGGVYDYFNDTSLPVDISSETFQTASTYSTGLIPAGSYRIDTQFRYGVDAANKSATIHFVIDGVPVGINLTIEQSDSTNFDVKRFFGVVFFPTEAAHTITLEGLVEDDNKTLTVYNAQWELFRVSVDDITT